MAHDNGSMDIQQHKEMWANFVRLTVWVAGLVAVVLAGLAIFVY